jgi:hypothetical protein
MVAELEDQEEEEADERPLAVAPSRRPTAPEPKQCHHWY